MPTRRATWIAAVAVVLVALVATALVMLPVIARRMMVQRVARLTGRAVTLDDIDLNIFTGRLALKKFSLAQRASTDAALAFDRLDIGVSLTALLTGHARFTELSLTAPMVVVTRTHPDRFDFSDLLDLIPTPDPNAPPTWTVTLDHVAVRDGTIIARDRMTSPVSEWRMDGFSVECQALTTRATTTPGRVTVKAHLGKAGIELNATAVRLDTGAFTARLSVVDTDLAHLAPYVPPTIAAFPRAGRADVTLDVSVDRASDGSMGGSLKGELRARGVEVVRREAGNPVVLTLAQVAVLLDQIDLRTREITLRGIELDGLTVAANRGPDGVVDLIRLVASTTPAATGATPAPTAPAAPRPPIKIQRVALRGGTVSFTDQTVSPTATFAIGDLLVELRDVAWPGNVPLAFDAKMSLPGGGTFAAQGTARLDPVDLDVATSLRDAPIDPYGPYFPFAARFTGRLNGDNRARVTLTDGAVAVSSKGDGWIVGLAVRDPAAPAGSKAPAEVDRVELRGVEFTYPGRSKVARVGIRRPELRLERAADGSLPLLALFAVKPAHGATPATPPSPPAARDGRAAGASTEPAVPLEVAALVIEEGLVSFTDRATQPPFSESVSKLAVSVDGLSNVPGRRAKLKVRAGIGNDATLDVTGTIVPFGTLFADLALDLKDFGLPRVSPYSAAAIAWTIERGRMAAALQYRIEDRQLTAKNHVVVGDLEVAKAAGFDTAEQRLGLPLGLLVSLVKDGQGRIVLDVPVTGSLDDPTFDWSETIWTAIKNVLVNVAAGPFRAIGRLVTGGDKRIERLAVEPVKFPPGESAVSPDMERHLSKVVEFLKGAPGVALVLAPVVTSEDADTLRRQALAERLVQRQRDAKLPDREGAIRAEFRERFPKESPLPSLDEQFARLLELEPEPHTRLAELQARRLEAVRAPLASAGGVAPERVRTGEPVASKDVGGGRVDFSIVSSRT
jgi:uncharacterized protein involved in outer membrane biogenesis